MNLGLNKYVDIVDHRKSKIYDEQEDTYVVILVHNISRYRRYLPFSQSYLCQDLLRLPY